LNYTITEELGCLANFVV